MSEADPAEPEPPIFDGYPAHTWEGIEADYRQMVEWKNFPFDTLPLAELARRVQLFGIGRSLGGMVSMRALRCMMHKQMYHREPSLVIDPNPDRTFTFAYIHSSGGLPKDDWTATYPAEQVMPAFSRFLTRVGWVPEGHPAHKILLGEVS